MSATRATITAYDPVDRIGRMQLESGEEVRFGATACPGITPSVGLALFVVELEPHPLGGRRVKVANLTGDAQLDPLTAATHESERREAEVLAWRERDLTFSAQREVALAALDGPFPAARGTSVEDAVASALMLIDDVMRLHAASFRRGVSAMHWDGIAIASDFVAVTDRFTDRPLDPSFLTLIEADGDAIGIYLYPPAIARGEPAPVVLFDHELAPPYRCIASDLAAFVAAAGALANDAALVARGRPSTTPAPTVRAALDALDEETPSSDERAHVRALMALPESELDAARALDAVLAERDWRFHRAALRHRIVWLEWQQKIDGK